LSGYAGILWAALATGAFSVMFNLRGRDVPVSALGGALGWAVYLLAAKIADSEGVAYFVAAAAVALYAEAASRLLSAPAGPYVACAIISLVPGGGMYYMMSDSLAGNLPGTLAIGFSTLGTAGAIAAGLAIGSAVARLAKRL
jgi:uncharacterized membrane protein YjjB (DUF3815 family)